MALREIHVEFSCFVKVSILFKRLVIHAEGGIH